MTFFTVMQALFLSLAIGALMGLTGAGGGSVYVLLLTFTFKRPPHEAVGTALALSTVTSLTGVIGHLREKNVSLPHALTLGCTGTIAAILSGWLGSLIPETILRWLIIIVFLGIGIGSLEILWYPKNPPNLTGKRWPMWRQGIVGTIIGIASGSFGVSGGTPIASYLATYEGLPTGSAVGTALAVVSMMSLAGAFVYFSQGNLNPKLLGLLVGGAVVGAYSGARLTRYINRRVLLGVLSLLTLIAAVGVFRGA